MSPRCTACNGPLSCRRCAGAKGGRTVTPARRAAMKRALAYRFRWRPGDKVQPRLRKDRSWLAEVVRVGHGRVGSRHVRVRVYWGPAGVTNYETTIAESLLARVRA